MTAAGHTKVVKPQAAKQALYTQRETRTVVQKYVRIDRCRRKLSNQKKPTKAGMELANQIHFQPLAICIGERKVFKH